MILHVHVHVHACTCLSGHWDHLCSVIPQAISPSFSTLPTEKLFEKRGEKRLTGMRASSSDEPTELSYTKCMQHACYMHV